MVGGKTDNRCGVIEKMEHNDKKFTSYRAANLVGYPGLVEQTTQ